MKHQPGLNSLFEFMDALDFALSVRQREQMGDYLDLLKKWSLKQNLVSGYDIAHLVERHFLPSLYLNACLPEKIKGALMDLGSGAGFPGVLIAIMRPGLFVTLLDSSRKKTLFLEEVCEVCGLDCQVVCQRCEIYAKSAGKKYQIIVSRAVARISMLLNWTNGLLDVSGSLYLLKGGDEINELEQNGLTFAEYKIIRPGNLWTDYSSYMQNKFIMQMEK